MATKVRITAQEFRRFGAGDVRRELVNGERDVLQGEDVMPGLTIPLADVFA